MLLGDIIKKYRSEHNMSMQNFADLIKSSKSYVSMLEKNSNPSTGKPISPSLETLKLIADAMNVDIDYLLKMLDDNQEILLNEKEKYNIPEIKCTTKGVKIPVLGRVIAGQPIEAVEDILGYETITRTLAETGEFFCLVVKGNSMEPNICGGDIVVIRKQNDVESGNIAVVLVNGNDATIKKIIKNKDGIILQPTNLSYNPIFYSNEQIQTLPVQILGKVMENRRKYY